MHYLMPGSWYINHMVELGYAILLLYVMPLNCGGGGRGAGRQEPGSEGGENSTGGKRGDCRKWDAQECRDWEKLAILYNIAY